MNFFTLGKLFLSVCKMEQARLRNAWFRSSFCSSVFDAVNNVESQEEGWSFKIDWRKAVLFQDCRWNTGESKGSIINRILDQGEICKQNIWSWKFIQEFLMWLKHILIFLWDENRHTFGCGLLCIKPILNCMLMNQRKKKQKSNWQNIFYKLCNTNNMCWRSMGCMWKCENHNRNMSTIFFFIFGGYSSFNKAITLWWAQLSSSMHVIFQ